MIPQEQQLSRLSDVVFAASCGNSFAIAEGNFCDRDKELLIDIISRNGLDTALLIEQIAENKFIMYVIERDGSLSNFCGNGAKAVGCYLFRKNRTNRDVENKIFVGNADKFCLVSSTDNYACIYIPQENIRTENDIVYVMEEPHRINFYTADQRGETVIHGHPVNESFIEKVDDDTYEIVTWERGVNDFTKSCGSACIASASIINRPFLYFICPGGINRISFSDGHYILSSSVEFL